MNGRLLFAPGDLVILRGTIKGRLGIVLSWDAAEQYAVMWGGAGILRHAYYDIMKASDMRVKASDA